MRLTQATWVSLTNSSPGFALRATFANDIVGIVEREWIPHKAHFANDVAIVEGEIIQTKP
jgi:hypothetical protein